jgi:hypothetical protein
VYAFGITLYELISRNEPYSSHEGQNFDDILPLVANPGPDSSLVRPEIPPSCPEELRKIIKECWAHHAQDRPTFDDLALRARALDLTAVGIGPGSVQEILYDMFPKHVSMHGCVCVNVCACVRAVQEILYDMSPKHVSMHVCV